MLVAVDAHYDDGDLHRIVVRWQLLEVAPKSENVNNNFRRNLFVEIFRIFRDLPERTSRLAIVNQS